MWLESEQGGMLRRTRVKVLPFLRLPAESGEHLLHCTLASPAGAAAVVLQALAQVCAVCVDGVPRPPWSWCSIVLSRKSVLPAACKCDALANSGGPASGLLHREAG